MDDWPLILLVDDERALVRAMSLRLQSVGYDTVVAHDGESGLDLAILHRPEAMILDVRMPGMDGLTLLDELSKREETSGIAVVVVSAVAKHRERALARGGRFFLEKPFDSKHLLAALCTIIPCRVGD